MRTYSATLKSPFRDPTCLEVLQLLPRLDGFLETSLSDKINVIVGLGRCTAYSVPLMCLKTTLHTVPPFRLLDLPAEVKLQAYAYVLPRQPYLNLIDMNARRHALPRYDIAALRTCRQIHNELVDHFYEDQVLVLNVYNISAAVWAFTKMSSRDRLLIFNMRRETRS